MVAVITTTTTIIIRLCEEGHRAICAGYMEGAKASPSATLEKGYIDMGWHLLVSTVVHFFVYIIFTVGLHSFLPSTDMYSHFNSFLFMPPLAVFHNGFWAAHVMHNIAMGKGPFPS